MPLSARDGAADLAHAGDSHATRPRIGSGQRPPLSLAPIGFVLAHLPVMAQHAVDRVLDHALGERRIDQPDEGHMGGEIRIADDMVDARPQRRNELEIGIALQLARRILPHQREIDRRRIGHVRPLDEIEVGGELGELRAPRLGAVGAGEEEEVHVRIPASSTTRCSKAAAISARV
jgi:hypothetical protein